MGQNDPHVFVPPLFARYDDMGRGLERLVWHLCDRQTEERVRVRCRGWCLRSVNEYHGGTAIQLGP